MVGAARFDLSLTDEKVLLSRLTVPRTTTPLRMAIPTASSATTVTTKETRGGATRFQWPVRTHEPAHELSDLDEEEE